MPIRTEEARRVRQLAGSARWSAEEAREVITVWERSGESMTSFARRHGLSPQRLGWWRQRLAPSSTVTLVPATVRAAAAREENAAPLSVVVSGAVRLDIARPGLVSPAWVASLLDELATRRGS
jgi:transposase-like protein